jgi:hypothetical protein
MQVANPNGSSAVVLRAGRHHPQGGFCRGALQCQWALLRPAKSLPALSMSLIAAKTASRPKVANRNKYLILLKMI